MVDSKQRDQGPWCADERLDRGRTDRLCGAASADPSEPAQSGPHRVSSPASDSCSELTSADVTAAIAALPGWSYDYWSTSETIDGTPQDTGGHSRAEYVAPDRLREVFWVRVALRAARSSSATECGCIPIQMGSPSTRQTFRHGWSAGFRSRARSRRQTLPFLGDLPGEGLRESPRVADTECLATDPDTGTSLVTTRSGQLVRVTSERRSDRWIETKALIFHATPPAIEPPSAEELRPRAIFPDSG